MPDSITDACTPHDEPTIVTQDDRMQRAFEAPHPDSGLGDVTWKTLISAPKTPTNSLTAGYATCAAGTGFLSLHRHAPPEIYYITKGRGAMVIGGVERVVAAGDVIFIPGNVEHGIKSIADGSDADVDLEWFYVFAVDGFSKVVYVN